MSEDTPSFSERPSVEYPASQEQIAELVHLARLLEPVSDEITEFDNHCPGPIGGILLRQKYLQGNGYVENSGFFEIVSPSYPEEHESLLAIMYEETSEIPIIDDDTLPSKEDLEKCRSICVELVCSGKLNDLETALTLRTISFLAGFLDNYNDESTTIEFNGEHLKFTEALSRAISQRHDDFMYNTVYESDFNLKTGEMLTITNYDSTDPARYPDSKTLVIELDNHRDHTSITLRVYADGSTRLREIDRYSESELEIPEIYHVQKLRQAVEAELKLLDLYPEEIAKDSENKKDTDWLDLLQLAISNEYTFQQIPVSNETAKQAAAQKLEEVYADLQFAFEKQYHLTNRQKDIDSTGILLEHIMQNEGLHSAHNILDIDTRRIFFIDENSSTRYKEDYVPEDNVVRIHYLTIGRADMVSDGKVKQPCIIGVAFNNNSGQASVCVIPLTEKEDKSIIYSFSPSFS